MCPSGCFRIRGELLKLGHTVAATTIRSVLLDAGIPPAGRRSQLTWKQFLAAHAETLVAADFFNRCDLEVSHSVAAAHRGARRVRGTQQLLFGFLRQTGLSF